MLPPGVCLCLLGCRPCLRAHDALSDCGAYSWSVNREQEHESRSQRWRSRAALCYLALSTVARRNYIVLPLLLNNGANNLSRAALNPGQVHRNSSILAPNGRVWYAPIGRLRAATIKGFGARQPCGLRRPHGLRRFHGLRRHMDGYDPIGCGKPIGAGDPKSCGDPMGCGDMGSGDPIGCGDPVGCGDPMGCGNFGCGDPMGGGDPMDCGDAMGPNWSAQTRRGQVNMWMVESSLGEVKTTPYHCLGIKATRRGNLLRRLDNVAAQLHNNTKLIRPLGHVACRELVPAG